MPGGYQPRIIDTMLTSLMAELPAILVVGARAVGKTTTCSQHAAETLRLDVPPEARAVRTDPDALLSGRSEPLLIDEWQEVPETLPAIKRAVDANPSPGRFLLTGSVSADTEHNSTAGTGRITRLRMTGLSIREREGTAQTQSLLAALLAGSLDVSHVSSSLSISDYLDLALTSGFPEALALSETARAAWLEGYVAQVTARGIPGSGPTGRPRDPLRLRRYLEAYALNSAGMAEARTLYEAAEVNKVTATAYEALLEDLFLVERVPAWTTNRLRRLRLAPKRYVTDAALMAAIARADRSALLRDGDLLGRMIDTFVVSQIRSELTGMLPQPRLLHLRQRDGRREVDLIIDAGGGRIVAIEIKAAASVGTEDGRHLAWLRDQLGPDFVAGVVFHTGPRGFRLSDRVSALPLSALWSLPAENLPAQNLPRG